MSASALKSTIPGVGTSPTSTSHSILPMNAMAQKVVSGSEPGPMKPLSGTGLSYVTLQPPSQPLSLVQDHRPSVYQTPPYVSSNSEKESESEKLVPNGVEIVKTESSEQSVSAANVKQSESNRNNNLSPDNPTQEQQREAQAEPEAPPVASDFPAPCPQPPAKVEEKKVPVNNGSKESDGIPITPPSPVKQSPQKTEDSAAVKAEVPKPKPVPQVTKVASSDGNIAPSASSPPKAETKVTSSPKANKRKSRELKDLKGGSAVSDGANKPKRNRIQTQPYQSPLPEIALLVKNLNKSPPSKATDDKLIVFYKNEFLAVRNAEGSFYVCQAMQNIYKSSRRIRIRWLSQDKNNGEIYSPDFYDFIDFDCILTNLNLNKIDKNKFQLTKIELLRTENILKRAIDVEAGVSEKPRVTEEHPDGLDLSLYKDESQLKKRKSHSLLKQKQSLRKKSKRSDSSSDDDASLDEEKTAGQSNRPKKRTVNKALAIAKSVAKGSSRAERALNRSTKSGNEVATSSNASVATGPAVAPPTSTGSPADVSKNNTTDIKKSETKKSTKQQSNNSTSGVTRTKIRASAQNTQQSSKVAGRPKRMAASTVILSSEEAASQKKKWLSAVPRGRV